MEPKFESGSVTSKPAFLNNNNNISNNNNNTVMVGMIVWTYIVLVMCQAVLQVLYIYLFKLIGLCFFFNFIKLLGVLNMNMCAYLLMFIHMLWKSQIN